VHRDWAPLAADRFYNLVKNGFYDDIRFFRVARIHGAVRHARQSGHLQAWSAVSMKDEPTKQTNKRIHHVRPYQPGRSRGTQVFINYKENSFLDKQGFAPFGEVTKGMDVVEKINARTERAGSVPNHVGRERIPDKEFPKLDYIKTATIEK